MTKKPCHCDPSLANLIDTGERVWLVDWEYSGMNDPMWDLAYLSNEAALDPDRERALATAYFGREPGDAEIARIEVLKAGDRHSLRAVGADSASAGK